MIDQMWSVLLHFLVPNSALKQQQGPGSAQPIRIDIVGASLIEIGNATSEIVSRMREIAALLTE